MHRLVLAVAGVAWVPTLAPAPVPVAAAQPAPEHRAAVIVDTGTEVRRVCVRFSEESLTGIEALVRAGTDPVLRTFAGKGAAVCSLCGTGCPGDESCLTCDSAGRFWSYSRAPSGTGALRTSGVGASGTTVRDGDVEGWRWGTGGTPPFATVAEVCGDVTPTTTTSTAAATTTTAASAVTTAPAAGATTTTAHRPRPASSAPATTAPPSATTTAPAPAAGGSPPPTTPEEAVPSTITGATTAPPRGDLAASRRSPTDDGGSAWGLVAFGATLAGLAGWSAAARRRRRSEPGG